MSDSMPTELGASVVVADAMRLTRDALVGALRKRGITVTASSVDAATTVDALESHVVDAVVCNIATVDLVGLVAAVNSMSDVPTVAFGVPNTASDVQRCAELNLAGFVLVDEPIDELIRLVQTTSRR